MTYINEKEKIVYISPPEDIMNVDQKKLKKIINEYIQFLRDTKKITDLWLYQISDEADILFHEIYKDFRVQYKDYWIIDNSFDHTYPHHLSLSIRFEVLQKLSKSVSENLQPHELLLFKKFLETPEGEELEAWAWWEEYWKNRVIPEE